MTDAKKERVVEIKPLELPEGVRQAEQVSVQSKRLDKLPRKAKSTFQKAVENGGIVVTADQITEWK